MSAPSDASTEPPGPPLHGDKPISARADLAGGVGWVLFGAAVLIGSITMDRLEQQHINPYTVPGLLPALLGIAMILLGGILALRSWRRDALHMAGTTPTPSQREQRQRIAIVITLCLGYGVVLVGHGLPFWLASAIFVTSSILILQRLSREAQTPRVSWLSVLKALVIGLSAALITHGVFQELFLVRLP